MEKQCQCEQLRHENNRLQRELDQLREQALDVTLRYEVATARVYGVGGGWHPPPTPPPASLEAQVESLRQDKTVLAECVSALRRV
jgi:hypothetical protein